MLSNIQHNLSRKLGILNKNEGAAERTTFIVDPKQTVRFIMVNDLNNVGRNPHEVLTGT
nr:redoxin domain-containing protein [Coxiella-like endosymbiont of Rhipicephalus sanguineus]